MVEIEPMRWVIRGESEFAAPVHIPETQVKPGEETLLEIRDLQPQTGTTTMREADTGDVQDSTV